MSLKPSPRKELLNITFAYIEDKARSEESFSLPDTLRKLAHLLEGKKEDNKNDWDIKLNPEPMRMGMPYMGD